MNRNYWVAFIAFVFVCMSNAGPVRAAVVYSQTTPPQPTGAFSSTERAAYQKIADNFLLPGSGAATIRSLRFIGGYGVTKPPPQTPALDALPPDDFRVVFITNSSGAPGAPLAGGDFHVGAPLSRSPTGGPMLHSVYPPLQYFIDLGAGVTLDRGTVYWLSIVDDPGTNYFWDWANGAGAYDQGVASSDGDIQSGPWQISSGGGMWFELSDNNVPEPTTVGMLTVAAFGLWQLRARYQYAAARLKKKRGHSAFLNV